MRTRRRAILVTGAAPGAGKTSLSRLLSRRLAALGIENVCLTEEDLLGLDPFARFDEQLGRDDPAAIDSLAEGVHALFGGQTADDPLLIADALLPGFFWLLGRYPFERVQEYRDELAESLRSLHPMLVYLVGDVRRLFGRAVSQRGPAWGERMAAAIRRWRLPLCPLYPLGPSDDPIPLLEWLDQQTRELLADWPGPALILDASDEPVAELAERVLREVL